MKTGYQVYKKACGETSYKETGILNWFETEEEAIARCEALNNGWKDFGYEYIVVKLG